VNLALNLQIIPDNRSEKEYTKIQILNTMNFAVRWLTDKLPIVRDRALLWHRGSFFSGQDYCRKDYRPFGSESLLSAFAVNC